MTDKTLYISIYFQPHEVDDNYTEQGDQLAQVLVENHADGHTDNPLAYTVQKPHLAKYDSIVGTYNEWTLLCNNTIGGDYLLWRPATEEEKDWYYNRWLR